MRRSRTRVISDRRWRGRIALSILVLAAAVSPVAAAKDKSGAREQLAFGVEMARRGLWNEALFRFEQVRALQPADPRVLNNLAVAYEAVGRFDDAEALYGEALQAAPTNRDIKRNVTRFREFLQSFRAKKATPESPASPAPPTSDSTPPEGAP